MKVQIWLNPQQIDLITDCLRYVKGKINDHMPNETTQMTGRYFCRRIDEVLELFSQKVDVKGEQNEH